MFCWGIFRRANFAIQRAENMERCSRSASFFPSLASPRETKSKKDRLCAFSPLCLPSRFYFPIFAAHSLSVEVENLK